MGIRTVLRGMVLVPLVSGLGRAAVIVDAGTRVIIGSQDRISANLFGITAFEGFPAVVHDRDYRARVAALRPGCIRLAGNITWCAPKDYDPAWYDTPQAAAEFSQVLLFGARYPTGRFLPVVRELGAEPMCSLGSPPPYLTQAGMRHPSDFDKWAAYCAGYLGLWKEADPDLRLVQIWNEPNATWYLDPRPKERDISSAELHIEMANKVARAIKERFPDVLIGGPVLCWPPAWPPAQEGHAPWYTWTSWTLPWLEETRGSVDFYDFHVYNVTPQDFAVQAEMLYNQALLTRERHLPIWITESNYHLAPEELTDPVAIWQKRILLYERLLLRGILPQADKIAGNLYHDLHAKNHTLLPGAADNPDPTYWLFWILRDLRGQQVVADSDDPDLMAYATLEGDCVAVVLFNDSAEEKSVPVTVSMPCGYWTGPYVRAIGEGPGGGCERIQVAVDLQRDGGRAAGMVRLPPFATTSILFRMNAFPELKRSRTYAEHFGDKTLQFIKGDEPVSVTITVPPTQDAKAHLRIGLLGPEGAEKLAARFNGVELDLQPSALQQIMLDAAGVKPRNQLEVWLKEPVDNPRLALGLASVVLETTR